MENVKPDIKSFLLPAGSVETLIGKAPGMARCADLPAIVTPEGAIVSQWKPGAHDLERLNAGLPITLIVYNGGRMIAPVALMVGGADLT